MAVVAIEWWAAHRRCRRASATAVAVNASAAATIEAQSAKNNIKRTYHHDWMSNCKVDDGRAVETQAGIGSGAMVKPRDDVVQRRGRLRREEKEEK
jgi:hypothetical protein